VTAEHALQPDILIAGACVD